MFPLKDHQPSHKFPIINISLIAANIFVFFKELTAVDLDVFIAQYALVPNLIDIGNPSTLLPFITSMFLHAGFVHILSNLWFLWIFGDNVEAAFGHLKYLLFYLVFGIAASLTQTIFIANSSLPMLGASGAIAGVLGAYLKFFPNHRIDTIVPLFGFPTIIGIPASFMLIYWFIIQAFSSVAIVITATASIGGIAYLAHAGGFVSGLIISHLTAKNWRIGK